MKLFKDILSYVVIVALFAVAGYHAGLFNNFNFSGFQNSLKSASYNVSNSNNKLMAKQNQSAQQVRGYKPNNIPDEVIMAAKASKNWDSLFFGHKKVIFYIYDDGNMAFKDVLSKYLSDTGLNRYYDLMALNRQGYKANSVSAYTTKICNSIEECVQVRNKAANHTLLTNFMDKCAKTVCIFNPNKKQYVTLRERKFSELKNLLSILKTW